MVGQLDPCKVHTGLSTHNLALLDYRAFSYDIFQHGGFYSNGNQYSFMQASFYIIVHNGFSMNFSIRGSSA